VSSVLTQSFINDMNNETIPKHRHIAVMPDEVLRMLAPKPGGVYLDGTLGAGGHSGLIGKAIAHDIEKNGCVISFDRDVQAVAFAKKRFAGTNIRPYHANYRDIDIAFDQLGIRCVDGMLLDLGLSSDQLDDTERGFSFDASGDLDLRFDTSEGQPMWKWLEFLTEERIADLIFRYGEERYSRRIAHAIVERRENRQPIRKANDFAQLVRRCIPHAPGKTRIDPATRTFQAMRIFVNDELGALEEFLKNAPARLNFSGRIVIISFHSLEDRLVKTAFRNDPSLNVLTPKPIEASDAEIERNPRARSAKLRVAEKK
jgi:16S rRNA (cytosine1402-N4)-methyltransferase